MHHIIRNKAAVRSLGPLGSAVSNPHVCAAGDHGHRTWTTHSPHYAECLTPQQLYTSSASSRCCGSKQGFLPSHCMCMYYGSSTNQ